MVAAGVNPSCFTTLISSSDTPSSLQLNVFVLVFWEGKTVNVCMLGGPCVRREKYEIDEKGLCCSDIECAGELISMWRQAFFGLYFCHSVVLITDSN
jgi:hypothetical protein